MLDALRHAIRAPVAVPDRSREDYYRYRSQAVAHALAGALDQARETLDTAWARGRVGVADQTSDLALVYLFAGDPRSALHVLTLGLRTLDGLTERACELFVLTLLFDPRLFRSALAAAVRHARPAAACDSSQPSSVRAFAHRRSPADRAYPAGRALQIGCGVATPTRSIRLRLTERPELALAAAQWAAEFPVRGRPRHRPHDALGPWKPVSARHTSALAATPPRQDDPS